MADFVLDVHVKGEDSLDKDMKAELNKLSVDVANIMVQLGQIMGDTLQKHIVQDVYQAYSPKTYPRRSENPRFGTPLSDVWANSYLTYNTAEGQIGGEVCINYMPTGVHTGTTADLDPSSPYYDADNPRPLKPNPANGNELIRRLETGAGYDWNAHPGKRPFWQETVKELIDDGELEHQLFWLLAEKGYDVLNDSGVERESRDGQY